MNDFGQQHGSFVPPRRVDQEDLFRICGEKCWCTDLSMHAEDRHRHSGDDDRGAGWHPAIRSGAGPGQISGRLFSTTR